MRHIVDMPLFFQLKKGGKKYHINLNNYHTWHYQVRNKLKKEYCKYSYYQLLANKIFKIERPIKLFFIFCPPDKRKRDRSNILSIHEKFFCDALVFCGVLKDDDDSRIVSTHYYTSKNKNGLVRIIIQELDH